jgi:hypothetical protein
MATIRFPVWGQMTDDQKFEFLQQRCDSLSQTLQAASMRERALVDRLQMVEAALAGPVLRRLQ